MRIISSMLVLSGLLSKGRATSQEARVVSVEYQELAAAFGANDDDGESTSACPQHLLTAVSEAFGPNGLGFLEISNIPERLVELRSTVLSLAPQLANLPAEELEALTLPDKDFAIGWSHGKEQFGVDAVTGQPIYDTRKGSFYLDPFLQGNNVFPQQSLPALEPALLEVTHAMSEAALWVSKLCDSYLQQQHYHHHHHQQQQQQQQQGAVIYNSLRSRVNTKARLLYYFPNDISSVVAASAPKDDWCGWHKDHGSLTALLPGMLCNVEKATSSFSSSSSNEPKPGLYIQTRDGKRIHVLLPPTSIGIQVGETAEIMSGGRLVATPHAVMSNGVPMSGRASLAVFLQPELHEPLPNCPMTADESLRKRYRSTFGAFQQATIRAFQ